MSTSLDRAAGHPRALLLVAHGSSDDARVGRPVREQADRLREMPDFDRIEVAFWDEEPSIEGALQRLDAAEVVVVPFFMSHGYYAGRVVPETLGFEDPAPGDVAEVADSRVVYTEAVGTHPRLRSLVDDRARDSLERLEGTSDPAEHALVLIGHGTPKHAESSTSTERMVERLRKFGEWGEVRAGFMDESPGIREAIGEVEHEDVAVVPFFVADGPHVADEIPEFLGSEEGRSGFPVDVGGHRVVYAKPVGSASGVEQLLAERARDGVGRLEGTRPDPDEWPLRRIVSEKIGSGPRSSSDMTREEATEAMERILDGRPRPETLATFLLANRWKKNTPDELGAFIDVMLERRVDLDEPPTDAPVVDCGAAYDGKQSTLLLGVAAGLVSAEAGAPVAVHSAGSVPTKEGVSYVDVLGELDVSLPGSPDESDAMLAQYGFGFYDRRQFHPGMAELIEHRRRIGARTFLNTIETLANPGRASIHLGSFYHLAFATRVIYALRASERSAFDRIVMFQGLEGYDDVRPGSTKVVEGSGGDLSDFDLEPGDLGLDFDRDDLRAPELAAASAQATEAVLLDGERGPVYDAVCLNAAARLYAAEIADSPAEGVERARNAIADGGAGRRLEALRGGRR